MASSHLCFESQQLCLAEAPTDVESQRPAQLQMSPEPVHMAAAGIDSSCNHATVPLSGDQLFSKLLCWTCSIGELLGPVVCGEKGMFICCEFEEGCGLGGRDNCIKCICSCEGMMPKSPFPCGCFCKCLPIKCGLTNPLEKPYVVAFQKQVVG